MSIPIKTPPLDEGPPPPLALRVLQLVPLPICRALFFTLGKIHYWIDSKHVEECEDLAQLCEFKKPRQMIKKMYEHLWSIVPEVIWSRKIGLAKTFDLIDGLDNFKSMLEQVDCKRGAIIVAAHLGNWELCGQILAASTSPILSVYKPNKKAWFNRQIIAFRKRGGVIPLAKEGAFRALIRQLKSGGQIGLIIDQHGGEKGVASEFLGKPCRTWSSAVELSQRMNCPLLPMALVRTGKRFRLFYKPPLLWNDDFPGLEKAVRQLDEVLSEMVREYPDQWMWLGRRWGRHYKKLWLKESC